MLLLQSFTSRPCRAVQLYSAPRSKPAHRSSTHQREATSQRPHPQHLVPAHTRWLRGWVQAPSYQMSLTLSCSRAQRRALHSAKVSTCSLPQPVWCCVCVCVLCLGCFVLTFVCDRLCPAVLLASLSHALEPRLNAAASQRPPGDGAVRSALVLLRHANAVSQQFPQSSKPQASSGLVGKLLATQCAVLLQGVLAHLRSSSQLETGLDSLGLGPGDWAALMTSMSTYPLPK